MSKWVRITNAGDFDVASAVNMIGASVKECDSPIGLFGSGTKYALAQAARGGITVKIASGGEILTSIVEKQEFRNSEFDVVMFRSTTGKKVKTPITTKFGAEDWNQDWFIFREFFSNAIDEGSRQVDIVDKVEQVDGHTCVFLPYENFKEVYNNIDSYFTNQPNKTMWVGDGSIYRRGVLIGKLEGTKVCLHDDYVKINECRVMEVPSAISAMNDYMYAVGDTNIIAEFLRSDKDFLSQGSWGFFGTEKHYNEHVVPALIQVYGENYCICPNVDDIVRDVKAMGFTPVVSPTIAFNDKLCRTYKSLDNGKSIRAINTDERVQFDKAWKRIESFIPANYSDVRFFVISDAVRGLLGQADIQNRIVYICDNLLQPGFDRQLTNTVLHEMGHIITKAGDYDRAFTNWFIERIVDIAM